jgi:hypothetical protein
MAKDEDSKTHETEQEQQEETVDSTKVKEEESAPPVSFKRA